VPWSLALQLRTLPTPEKNLQWEPTSSPGQDQPSAFFMTVSWMGYAVESATSIYTITEAAVKKSTSLKLSSMDNELIVTTEEAHTPTKASIGVATKKARDKGISDSGPGVLGKRMGDEITPHQLKKAKDVIHKKVPSSSTTRYIKKFFTKLDRELEGPVRVIEVVPWVLELRDLASSKGVSLKDVLVEWSMEKIEKQEDEETGGGEPLAA